jgi:hypothetical protein
LLPKFVSEVAAMDDELRKRGTRRLSLLVGDIEASTDPALSRQRKPR